MEYVTKCLTEGTWGANDYELRKFNSADTVTLSWSVFRVIGDLDRMGADATARTCGKDGFPMREQPAPTQGGIAEGDFGRGLNGAARPRLAGSPGWDIAGAAVKIVSNRTGLWVFIVVGVVFSGSNCNWKMREL